MKSFSKMLVIVVLTILVFFQACEDNSNTVIQPDKIASQKNNTPKVSVFATVLNNPRGLKFGPDGYLYVAEGGLGGTNVSTGLCGQVVPPVGPYTWGSTGRISKISPTGVRTTVAENLPSSQTSPAAGSLVSSVADVAFIGNTLYALLAGAGCSHGYPSEPNGVIKVNANGTWNLIANLSDWSINHPVANPDEDGYEPDGTWYSMINVQEDLYAVEPNHGELVRVKTNGQVNRVIDISATQGHIIPTALAYHDDFYIGNLNTFPVIPGSSGIFKVAQAGGIQKLESGLTAVLGLVFDNEDNMYVLEMSTMAGDPEPYTGKIIRIEPSGVQKEIVTGLFFPTGMTIGPDGNLYVSNKGFGPPYPGFGEILKVVL